MTEDQLIARVIIGKISKRGDKSLQRELGIGYDKLLRIKRENGLVRKQKPVTKVCKLSDADVVKLRNDRKEHGTTYKALGIKYNVSKITAWKLCNGWRKDAK